MIVSYNQFIMRDIMISNTHLRSGDCNPVRLSDFNSQKRNSSQHTNVRKKCHRFVDVISIQLSTLMNVCFVRIPDSLVWISPVATYGH